MKTGVLLLPYPFRIGFQDYHEAPFFTNQLQKVVPQQLVTEAIGFEEEWQDKGYDGPYIFELRAE